jgi:hypothetical protein
MNGLRNLLSIVLFSLIGFSSCNQDDELDCPGQLQASWRVNGNYEESYDGFYGHT